MYSYDGISSHQASGQILFQWPLHVWSRTRISWGQWGNPGIHSIYLNTDSIRYIPNFSVIRKLHKHTGELSYFRTSAGENPLKLILSNSLDCFRCKHCGVLIELHVLRDLKRFRVNLVECTSFNFPLVAWLKACLYIWR